MPSFKVKDPSGTVYTVNAPEGATEDQVLSYAQANFGNAKEGQGDFMRGLTSIGSQDQEVLGGLQTLLGAGAKHVLGKGVVSDYLLGKGVKNLKEANESQEKNAKESDDLENAYHKGISTVLTDWLPYQIGSGVSNLAETGAFALAGGALGTAIAPGAGTLEGAMAPILNKSLVKQGIKNAAKEVLENELKNGATKDAAKIAAQTFVEDKAKQTLAKEELAKYASSGASTFGQNAGVASQALFHGIGEPTSRAAQEAGYDTDKIDFSKLAPAVAVHSLADFAAEKIGLGGLKGIGSKSTRNLFLDIGKGMLATGAKEVPPELVQQAAERYGAGLPLADKNAINEYINTAGGAFAMGIVPGGVGGVNTRMNAAPIKQAQAIQEPEQEPVQEPLQIGMSKPFTPTPLPDGSVAMTQEELDAYHENQFSNKYKPQRAASLALGLSQPFSPVSLPDGSVALTQQDLDNYRREKEANEFQQKYAAQPNLNQAQPSATPLAIGYSPLPGTLKGLPNGQVALNDQQALQGLYAPQKPRITQEEWNAMSPEDQNNHFVKTHLEQQNAINASAAEHNENPIFRNEPKPLPVKYDEEGNPIAPKATTPEQWAGLGVQQKEKAVKTKPEFKATEHPENIGIVGYDDLNNPITGLLSEGATRFKHREDAIQAKKLQPLMRILSIGNEFVLTPKTQAQLDSEKKNNRNLGKVTASGEKMGARSFIASQGGLHPDEKTEMGHEDVPNIKVGAGWLYAGQNNPEKGMRMDKAATALHQSGYILDPSDHEDVRQAIKNDRQKPENIEESLNQKGDEEYKDYQKSLLIAHLNGKPIYEDELENELLDNLISFAKQIGIDTRRIHEEAFTRGETQAEAEDMYHQFLTSAIKDYLGNKPETLQSKDVSNKPANNPEEARIQKELTGKTFIQAAQWAIANAPNSFARFVANKVLTRLQAMQKAGVVYNFEVASGNSRTGDLRSAKGLTSFVWGAQGQPTLISIKLNGAPVFANQNGFPSGMDYTVVLHELLHAATRGQMRFLASTDPLVKEIRSLHETVVNKFNEEIAKNKGADLPDVLKNYYKRMNNALSDPDELISWGMTDKGMQKFLSDIKVGNKTVFSHIIGLIRQVLGIAKNFETALDRLVRTTESLLDDTLIPLQNGMVKEGYALGKPSTGKMVQQSLFSKKAQEMFAMKSVPEMAQAAVNKAQDVLQKRAPSDKSAYEGMPSSTVDEAEKIFHPRSKTIIDRIAENKDNFWKMIAQKTVDQYRAIKDFSPMGYMQARLASSVDGGLHGMMFNGHIALEDGALTIKQGDNFKGMIQALAPLGKEVDRFQQWMALNREALLPEHKRTPALANLVSKKDEYVKGEINGRPRIGKDKNGKDGVYEQARKDMMALNKSVLDVALKQNLIDKEAYERFSNDAFYVPFYKVMEDGKIESIRTASRMTNQQFSKMLKGGGEKPFSDLMENTLRNWSHILSASMKNQASLTTIQDASGLGAATPNLKQGFFWKDGAVHNEKTGKIVGNGDLVQEGKDEDGNKKMLSYTTAGRETVKVNIEGHETHFHINDPFLFESLSAVTYLGPQSKVLDVMRGFKNALRFGVTLSPAFKASNLIKDSIQAAGLSGLNNNFVKNVMDGWASSHKDSPVYIAALAGGGVFNYGTTLEGNRSEVIKKLLARGVNGDNIVDTKEKAKFWLTKIWHNYEDIGNRSENINRIALYEKLKSEGMSHLEASYHARDLMDFSMQGSSGAIRYLSQIVPFLNARLQGLYKLGRDGVIPTVRVFYRPDGNPLTQDEKQKAQSFMTVAGAVSLASMALYMAFKDDDDFKKREQWDRDFFWWFKIPGTQEVIRIPKPFEFGSIGTLAERSLEQIVDKDVEGKRFGESIGRMVFQTFSMDPTPQFFKPLIDVYANKDSFTNAPIETAGMERLSKQERMTNETSALAKGLGGVSKALGAVSGGKAEMSPVQIDYMIKSYLGWLGGTIATTSQYAMMPFNNGVYADADWQKRMSLGFVQKLPSVQSTYVTDFYQNNQAISEAYADMRHYAEIGDSAKVQQILEEKGDLIRLEKMYDATSKNMANIRKQLNHIQDPNNTSLTGEQKANEVLRLKGLISDLAQRAESIRLSMKK